VAADGLPDRSNFWNTNLSGPFLYQQVTGNFSIETRINCTPNSNYKQAVLLVKQVSDSSNWISLGLEYSNGRIIDFENNRKRRFGAFADRVFPGNECISEDKTLRLCFTCSYSSDGSAWTVLSEFSLSLSGTLQAGIGGMGAISGTDTLDARFDYVHYTTGTAPRQAEPFSSAAPITARRKTRGMPR